MKKITALFALVLALMMVFTGCIKFTETLKIDEEGKITLTIVSAVLEDETDSEEAEEAEEEEAIEGMTVEDYNEDGYVGKIYTYESTIKDNADDSVMPDEISDIDMSLVAGFILEGDKVILSINSSSGNDYAEMEGFEDMLLESGAVFEFTIDLPFAPVKSNATKSSNDNKVLTWNLLIDSNVYAEYNKADFDKYFGEDYKYDAVNPFDDVAYGTYYHDAVIWAYNNNITTGTSKTAFSPASSCTRGQVVTFLWRSCGMPEPETKTNPFTDVNESDYFYKAVLWAVENGITNGTTATTFSPAKVCSNAHILTFIYRAFGEPEKTGEGEWYSDAVNWAEEYGITADTYRDVFDSTLSCPRSDVVTFLYRVMAYTSSIDYLETEK